MRLAAVLLITVSAAFPATWYVTVSGLGGEPDYEQRFKAWAMEIDKSLRAAPEARVETLVAGTRENLRARFTAVAKEAKPQDALVLMLIGHGAFDGVDYKINLPGPDIGAAELAALMDRVPAQRQLVVNMTSCSGGSVSFLKRANRVVISATRTGTEKNATVFARYWAEALRDPAADTDKNETVSALEAFQYAQKKTAAFYETQKRLATEHSIIEDGGAKLLPASFALLRLGSSAAAARDPAKRALLARKEDLEQQIDKLKYEKAALPSAEYKARLAALLLELAKTQEALDK
jgi:hypothetical protein